MVFIGVISDFFFLPSITSCCDRTCLWTLENFETYFTLSVGLKTFNLTMCNAFFVYWKLSKCFDVVIIQLKISIGFDRRHWWTWFGCLMPPFVFCVGDMLLSIRNGEYAIKSILTLFRAIPFTSKPLHCMTLFFVRTFFDSVNFNDKHKSLVLVQSESQSICSCFFCV